MRAIIALALILATFITVSAWVCFDVLNMPILFFIGVFAQAYVNMKQEVNSW